jgi:hypothetical protein
MCRSKPDAPDVAVGGTTRLVPRVRGRRGAFVFSAGSLAQAGSIARTASV